MVNPRVGLCQEVVKPSACLLLLDPPATIGRMSLMDNSEIRRENLRSLKKVHGSRVLLEKLGIVKQHLSQYIGKNPTRNIGDQFARDIERAFDKPRGWMDYLHDDLDNHVREIVDFARSLPADRLELLLQFLKTASTFAATPQKDPNKEEDK
jgi:hypothetical protein